MISAVTIDDVREIYRKYLGSGNGEIAIVGDFDVDQCVPLLQNMLADWKADQPYARVPRPIVHREKGANLTIRTPDKANATYAAGSVFALQEDDSDYPAMSIANYIFGAGSLASRLGDRVRQKEGLSYGVSSSLTSSAFEPRSTFSVSAICNPQNSQKL